LRAHHRFQIMRRHTGRMDIAQQRQSDFAGLVQAELAAERRVAEGDQADLIARAQAVDGRLGLFDRWQAGAWCGAG
jgi:hypothetical protein